MAADKDEFLPLLQRCTLTQGMTDEEIRELLASSEVKLRHYDKGEVIFHDGEKPKGLYILLQGSVRILKDTFSGRQIFLSDIDEPGDMFGEVYEVLQQPYDMYVEASAKTELLAMSSQLFSWNAGETVTHSALKVQRNLMRIFARKAYNMHNKIKVLASGSLREKIVRFLFQQLGQDRTVELTVSREYLAAYLAVTRPSLSRELSAMQRDGILEVVGKKIKVLDMERFEEYL